MVRDRRLLAVCIQSDTVADRNNTSAAGWQRDIFYGVV